MTTARLNKVIISCAITGSVHTPTMSAALPITPDEIAAQSIAAAEAGAAILHLQARDPKDGRLNVSLNADIGHQLGIFSYATTKWAVRGMSRLAASELATRRIGMNVIFAGIVDTPVLREND